MGVGVGVGEREPGTWCNWAYFSRQRDLVST